MKRMQICLIILKRSTIGSDCIAISVMYPLMNTINSSQGLSIEVVKAEMSKDKYEFLIT